MKKNGSIIFIIIAFIVGCDETSSTVCSLKEDSFNKEINDSMVVYVESLGSQIEMKGNLELLEGECNLLLKVPSGDTIFLNDTTYNYDTLYYIKSIRRIKTIFNLDSVFKYDTVYAIDSIYITDTVFTPDTLLLYDTIYNKNFKAENSFTINEKYDRILGKWTFVYKMKKIDTTLPEGSFDFVINYND